MYLLADGSTISCCETMSFGNLWLQANNQGIIFLGIYKNNSDLIYPEAQRHLKWSDHQNIHERGIAA